MSDYLICYRVKTYQPRLLSSRDVCSQCGEGVWRAYSSPEGHTAICLECAIPIIRAQEKVEFLRPTSKQMDDIRRALEKDA